MALWVGLILIVALDQTPGPAPRVQVADAWVNQRVKTAVIGAKARLDRPDCQRVLSDFQDTEGRQLSEVLEAANLSAANYLFERVWFVDGADTPQCLRDQTMAAFTSPGHKVVRVCADRFARRFERQLVAAEILVIHEMLHTLGLAENPPSTQQITQQVTRRCGRN